MTSPLVLLIEDEPLLLLDLEDQLVDAGFKVITAPDAAKGLTAFRAHADKLRAVVTDIRLGNGRDGWDVGREVRAKVSTMPVIYISGDSSAEWASRGVPNSVMIAKPFAFVQLKSALVQALNQADSIVALEGPSALEG